MNTAHVEAFLAAAHADDAAAARLKQALSFDDAAAIAVDMGFACSAACLQRAFAARDTDSLAREMLRHGLLDKPLDAPDVTWDDALWSRIQALDLEPVHKQLTNRKGWNPAWSRYIQAKYRGYLYLAIKGPSEVICPSPVIDDYWHQHILNTLMYARDSEAICGYFLHHVPSSGEEEERLETADMLGATMAIYERVFREPYDETAGEALLNRYPAADTLAA